MLMRYFPTPRSESFMIHTGMKFFMRYVHSHKTGASLHGPVTCAPRQNVDPDSADLVNLWKYFR